MLSILTPDWPAPAHIIAGTTLRQGGLSAPPYDTFNLSASTGDDAVPVNRRLLEQHLGSPVTWLSQVHSTAVSTDAAPLVEADGMVTGLPGRPCVVLTADCLPVLLCTREGREVAAVHAGWRGLAAGVIEAAIDRFEAGPDRLLAWLGPAISQAAFEVGGDVVEAFGAADPAALGCFAPGRSGRWQADLYALARQRLRARGVREIHAGNRCTYSEPEAFYSYRRDGLTGRMASFIMISDRYHQAQR